MLACSQVDINKTDKKRRRKTECVNTDPWSPQNHRTTHLVFAARFKKSELEGRLSVRKEQGMFLKYLFIGINYVTTHSFDASIPERVEER